MELEGNSADRWEQFSNKLGELATSVAAKKEMISAISSTLDDMMKQLETEQSELEQLGNLAYKEVLREESGTLNDNEDYSQPVYLPSDDQKPLKQPSESLTEANTEQPEATVKPTKQAKKRLDSAQMMLDFTHDMSSDAILKIVSQKKGVAAAEAAKPDTEPHAADASLIEKGDTNGK